MGPRLEVSMATVPPSPRPAPLTGDRGGIPGRGGGGAASPVPAAVAAASPLVCVGGQNGGSAPRHVMGTEGGVVVRARMGGRDRVT